MTITRTAGESRTQEQRAQIANQRNADLFIHISCFNDTALRPRLAFYYMASPPHSAPLTPYTLIPRTKLTTLSHERRVRSCRRYTPRSTARSPTHSARLLPYQMRVWWGSPFPPLHSSAASPLISHGRHLWNHCVLRCYSAWRVD